MPNYVANQVIGSTILHKHTTDKIFAILFLGEITGRKTKKARNASLLRFEKCPTREPTRRGNHEIIMAQNI